MVESRLKGKTEKAFLDPVKGKNLTDYALTAFTSSGNNFLREIPAEFCWNL